ncbi:MAG: Ig-like domain-containing protein, partial [Deltaproteobacteria bacterium]|nr:Ig-like domain-containing protein [Deltaproteobacteria bacterium]
MLWSVEEGLPGGTISASGLYTAPGTAGTYHVLAASHANPNRGAVVAITVTAAQVVSISVSPQTIQLDTSATQQFTANVTGASNTGVTWAITESGGGTVTSGGLYTAPAAGGVYHLVVTSAADTSKTATATITVVAQTVVGISVSPTAPSVAVSATQQFTATVTGTSNTDVTWSITQGAAGGTITSGGLYTAPATTGTYNVVATSAADTSKSASATVTV